MKIRLIAVGTRMQRWVREGFEEYRRRMPQECAMELVELALAKRGRNADLSRLKAQEGERLLAAAGARRIIAMDESGELVNTQGMATWMRRWRGEGRDVALLVGGPDGLAEDVLRAAERRWSLSPLTLPHGLVRVLVAEQCYRAWTVLIGHPYHRT